MDMVWMFSGIVFIAQIITCMIFRDKLKRYLPTIIALFLHHGSPGQHGRSGSPAHGQPDAGVRCGHRRGGAVSWRDGRLGNPDETP